MVEHSAVNRRVVGSSPTRGALFLSGRKLTAKEINLVTGGNDARKVISDLRKEGLNIQDIRQSNRCKLYWLAQENPVNHE